MCGKGKELALRERRMDWVWGGPTLYWGPQEGLYEEVTFELRSEGSEGACS